MKKDSFLATMAIGDAYGMRLEFIEHDCSLTKADLTYIGHPTYKEYKAGHYTDDTQMSLANAELLLSGDTTFSDEEFIMSWLNAYQRDPREGYSRYMQEVMALSRTPDEFRSRLNADRGFTSGGAMRAGVFGLLPDVADVRILAEQQARITHNTPTGVNSAQAVALGVHYLHHGGSRKDVADFIKDSLSSKWNSVRNGYTTDTNNGLNIVTQMLDVVSEPATLSQTLLNAANHAPVTDTDTLCALSLQLASRDNGTLDDLPQTLRDTFEKSAFGLAHLQEIDEKLLKAFPRESLYGSNAKVSHDL